MFWQPSKIPVASGREQWKGEGKAKARPLLSSLPLVDSASSGSWNSRAGLGLRVNEASEASGSGEEGDVTQGHLPTLLCMCPLTCGQNPHQGMHRYERTE